MKKPMTVCVAALLALGFAGCGGNTPVQSSEAAEAGASVAAERASVLAEVSRAEQPETPSNPEAAATAMKEAAVQTILIDIDGTFFTATLYDSETVAAFIELLPLTLTMGDYNQNEKVAALGQSLPTDAHNPGTIHTGDLMLYGSGSLVLFYDTFPTSYSYTPLGKLEDASGLAEIVGGSSIEAVFSMGG